MGRMDRREIVAQPIAVEAHVIAAVVAADDLRVSQRRPGAAVLIAAAALKQAAGLLPGIVLAAPVSGPGRADAQV